MHAGYQWQLIKSRERDSPSQAGAAAVRLGSSGASDRGSEASYEPGSSQHTRLLSGTGEVEQLRTALRQKEDQITSLQSQLTNLEATRDRYSGFSTCNATMVNVNRNMDPRRILDVTKAGILPAWGPLAGAAHKPGFTPVATVNRLC